MEGSSSDPCKDLELSHEVPSENPAPEPSDVAQPGCSAGAAWKQRVQGGFPFLSHFPCKTTSRDNPGSKKRNSGSLRALSVPTERKTAPGSQELLLPAFPEWRSLG